MKHLILVLSFLTIVSCNGQIDLEKLNFDKKISFTNDLKQDYSIYVPLDGVYSVKDITRFKYNNISLKSDSIIFKDEANVNKNQLNIIVDSYGKNNYIGFELVLINEKTSDEFFNLLKKKYGNPIKKYEYIENQYKDINYLWENKPTNEIIYFNKHNEINHLDKNNAILTTTRIIILKNGLSATIDTKDNRNNSENINAILQNNPNALKLLEIFKSQIRDN